MTTIILSLIFLAAGYLAINWKTDKQFRKEIRQAWRQMKGRK